MYGEGGCMFCWEVFWVIDGNRQTCEDMWSLMMWYAMLHEGICRCRFSHEHCNFFKSDYSGRKCEWTTARWCLAAYRSHHTAGRINKAIWRRYMCWRLATSNRVAGTIWEFTCSNSRHRWLVAFGPPVGDFNLRNSWRTRSQDSSLEGSRSDLHRSQTIHI